MAVQKVLAREWTKQVKSAGGSYLNVLGINSFSVATSKQDADTTDFDSNGWQEHLPATRGMTLSLDGYFMECPTASNATYITALTGTNNDLEFIADTAGAAGNNLTMTYVVAGLSTPLTVGLVGTDITVYVATDGAGLPTSTATQVKAALDGDGPIAALINTYNAYGNDGSGVVTAMTEKAFTGGADLGDRDPGQARCEALALLVGSSGIGDFRLISPGGDQWDFKGSVEVEGPGGDHQSVANWRCRVTLTGQITKS